MDEMPSVPPALVPMPVEVVRLPGQGVRPGRPQIQVAADFTPPPDETELRGALDWFAAEAESIAGARGQVPLRIDFDAAVPAEGYRLALHAGAVEVAVSGVAGIRRALATTLQLWRSEPGVSFRVRDEPALAIRGVHLDLKCQMPTLAAIEDKLRTLAEWKANALLLEYEDKFPYATAPAAVSDQALGPGDVQHIRARARALGIEVIPLVQTIAHLEWLLRAEGLGDLRENGDSAGQICPLEPRSLKTVIGLVDEIIAAHPDSRFIHLGGDESRDLGRCPRCAQLEKAELYTRLVVPACRRVIQAGKRPIVWADQVLADPRCLDRFPPQTIFMDWDYWTRKSPTNGVHLWDPKVSGWQNARRWSALPPDLQDRLKPYLDEGEGHFPAEMRAFPYVRYLRDQGFDVLCAPAASCAGDPIAVPDHHRHLANVLAFGQAAQRDGALGMIVTDWALRRCPPPTKWLALAAGCEAAWCRGGVSASHFWARYARMEFGPHAPAFLDASYALCRPAYLLDQSAPLKYDPDGFWSSKPLDERIAWLELASDGPKRKEALAWARDVRVAAARAEALLEPALAPAQPTDPVTPRTVAGLSFWLLAARESAVKADALLIFDRVEQYLAEAGDDPDRAGALAKALERLRGLVGEGLTETERLFGPLMTPQALDEETDVRYLGELDLIDKYLQRLGIEPDGEDADQ